MLKKIIVFSLVILTTGLLYAQQLQRHEIISAYLYNFAKNIEWQNEESISEYHFRIISDNKDLLEEFKKLASIKTLKGKPIKIFAEDNLSAIKNTHLIFLDKAKEKQYLEIFDKIEGKNILLVSENYPDKRLIMINFFTSNENTLKFEINRSNIINQGLRILPDMVFWGGTEIDVAAIYRESQQSLRSMQKQLDALQLHQNILEKQILAGNKEISYQHELISNQTISIDSQKVQLETKKLELIKLLSDMKGKQEQLTFQTEIIDQREKEIVQQKKNIEDQQKELASGNLTLAKQQTKIDGQNREIQKQQNILSEQGKKITSQRKFLYFLFAIVLLTLGLVFAIYRGFRQKKRANLLLQEQKDKIQNTLEELQSTQDLLIQAKQMAEAARAEAEKANKAKSEFLSNMSHELRTPLNVILGNSQLMQRDPAVGQKQKESLATINRSGEHLLQLINDVLGMAKIEAGHSTLESHDFDVYELLDNLESMFGILTREKGLEFHIDNSPEVPRYLYADQRKLRQIIFNLLSNAIKFTKDGMVTVSVDYRPDKEKQSRLFVSVTDTGPGIAAIEMDALFKSFEQTATGRQSYEGTGLGLVISQRFVKEMGGEISAVSEVGKGSVFSFNIPAQEGKEVVSRLEKHQIIGLEAGQKIPRILVVEDKSENRNVLVQLLHEVGIQTLEAVNGQEGVDSWQKMKPDLILMDMRMPIMDGFEATRLIRETETGQKDAQHVPIISVTASAFEEDRKIIVAAGCDDVISKPYHEAEIFEAMVKYLGIRFTYRETEEKTPELIEVTRESLSILPPDLLNELNQAAEIGHSTGLLNLMEKVEIIDSKLAQSLRAMIERYDFSGLSKLFKPKVNEEEK